MAAKAAVCPECGTKPTDWVDDRGRYRSDPTYEATPIRCFGCAAISTEAAKVPDREKGVRVVLRPADYPRS